MEFEFKRDWLLSHLIPFILGSRMHILFFQLGLPYNHLLHIFVSQIVSHVFLNATEPFEVLT